MPQRFPHEGEVMSSAQMDVGSLYQEGMEARQMPPHAPAKHSHHRIDKGSKSVADSAVEVICANRFRCVWAEGQRGVGIGNALPKTIDSTQVESPFLGKTIAESARKVMLKYQWR
jgi:hypothetical protein